MTKDEVKQVLARYEELQSAMTGVSVEAVHKTLTYQTASLVRSFVSKWGYEDALSILEQSYAFPHNGVYRGQPVGEKIFWNQKWGWYQNQMFLESSQENEYEENYFKEER